MMGISMIKTEFSSALMLNWLAFGNGLIMRKDYLEKYLSETGLELFWACYGEKQFFINSGQEWKSWNGLFYFENGRIFGSIEPQMS